MKLPKLSLKVLKPITKKTAIIGSSILFVPVIGVATILATSQSQTGADPVSPIQIQVNKNTDDIGDLQNKTDNLQTQVDGKEDRSSSSNSSSTQNGSAGSTTSGGNTSQSSNSSSNPPANSSNPTNNTPAQPRTAFSKIVTIQSGSISQTQAFPGYTNTSGTEYLSTLGNGGEPYAVQIPVNRISNFRCALDTGYLEDNTITRTYLYYGYGKSYSTQTLTADLPISVNGDICNYLYNHQRTRYVANGPNYYAADGSLQNAGQTLYLNSGYLADITLGTGNPTQIANPY